MKKAIQHSFFTLALLFVSLSSFSQSTLKQIIVLNEGHYDYANSRVVVPVTIGTYNPQTRVYTAFDTIKGARFASHVIIDNGFIYAAADNQLVKYDLSTLKRVNQQTVPGIRKMAVLNNLLYLTRGEYGVKYGSYFQAYDKSTLQLNYELDTLTGPKYASEAILVKDGIAYSAINNFGSGNIGAIGRVNLANQQYLSEVDLGTDGINPENLVVKDNTVYSVNNKDYNSSSVSAYNIDGASTTTTNIYSSGSCNGSALVNNNIAFQASYDNFLAFYSLQASAVNDTLHINKYVYQIASDSVSKNIYITATDYATYGKVYIYSGQGTVIDSFNASVTPGYFAFDYSNAAAVTTIKSSSANVQMYPTLVKDQVTVLTNGMPQEVTTINVTDCLGKMVYSHTGLSAGNLQINMANNIAGVYFVNVKSGNSNYTQKVVKL